MSSQGQKSTTKSQGGDKLKQKSLMSFFGKATDSASTATKSASTSKPKPREIEKATSGPSTSKSRSKSNVLEPPETPPKKGSQSSAVDSATYTHTSHGASSGRDTPPTSDPIDVDMMSTGDDDADNEPPVKAVSNSFRAFIVWLTRYMQPVGHKKRKAVIDDSDEDFFATNTSMLKNETAGNKSSGRARGCDTSTTTFSRTNSPHIGRSKKPRVSVFLSDEDDVQPEDKENSEDDAVVATFSKRLTKFKPAAKKAQRT